MDARFKVHVGASLNVGLIPEEIIEAMLHAAVYAGFPRALNATFAAKEVFDSRGIRPSSGSSTAERE
ncbi:alkylhydroperoxidase/carboxymuconolactone decarboxylase family protein YurZ [Catenuloplanes nepalensis]|uniref:Alkylhydroperoxidase/carboxymuconolactone decarboxylase family protein YurZ n=1 Tax=Catenuloplanes nepalensis TaxID=587533 RepID=A0ABT9N788_9ACTN|nr:carboxymuconolactone decarboxylase family protein [Catenuloplanes nepalensis]MDP9799549.1 alkylhydroperoxidase/carboxymuconolactone decarboxylase family protein YurZ [Catenuloplanes nepalensis]